MSEIHDDPSAEMDFDFSFDEAKTPEVDEASLQTAEREKLRKQTLFSRIPVTLTLEVASVEISLSELMNLNNDTVLELDKLAGEPLDVRVNGILFGRAEVVVLNDKYGLRLVEFNHQDLGELAP